MHARLWRTTVGLGLVALSLAALVSCTQGATARNTATPPTSSATSPAAGQSLNAPADHVVIVPQTDLFAPYLLVINSGDSVTWLNNDTVLHTILTVPRAAGGTIDPTEFQFVLPPGQQSSITLRSPGVYYYYCGAHATLTAQGRAAAMPTMRPYPLAMDGFIYVRGPGISAPSAATISLSPANQFTPWITVLNRGATVTWSNASGQAQDVAGIPGYGAVNPAPLHVHVNAGATASVHFTTPGIYDYYATGPATLDPVWSRPRARTGVAGYPVPMEGVIVILDY